MMYWFYFLIDSFNLKVIWNVVIQKFSVLWFDVFFFFYFLRFEVFVGLVEGGVEIL